VLPRRYTDPLGSKLPALERNILKLRAMQILLVLFYVEELKRWLVNHVKANRRLANLLSLKTAFSEQSLEKTNKLLESALNALVVDRAITAKDKAEIVRLID
jgi:hypothetical protein